MGTKAAKAGHRFGVMSVIKQRSTNGCIIIDGGGDIVNGLPLQSCNIAPH
jgi:hypothetical protein